MKENFENGNGNPNPLAEIEAIKAEIMATGAVDSEPRELENIKRQYEIGEISGEEAIKRAREIQESRQSYH